MQLLRLFRRTTIKVSRQGLESLEAVYRRNIKEAGIELIDKIRRTNYNTNAKIIYKDKTVNKKSNYVYYITALDRIHNESDYLEIVYK